MMHSVVTVDSAIVLHRILFLIKKFGASPANLTYPHISGF